MTETAKKPAIRFDGFTEAWEQRKLSEYLEVSSEKNTEDTFTKQDVLSVSGDYGIVNQIEFQGRSFAGASVSDYGVVRTGDVVYTKSPLNLNPYGIIKTNKGKPGIVSTLYAVYHPRETVVPDFVQVYFEQHARMNNYMHPLVNKGAKNDMKVSSENALKGDVIFPDITEQRQNVALFAKLDNLITLHQQKYDKLLTFKKSMLEKMFPQNGAKVPEVRFAGFAVEWEFKKFGEVFEEYSEKNHDELPALTIIQGGGTVRRDESGRSIQYDESGLKGYKLVREGDFIVHLRSFEGGLEKANSTGIVSPAYHMFHGEGTDTRFFYAYFRSKQFVDVQLKPHVYGIRDGRSIDIAGMKTILIPYPSLPEQQKIGDFLEKIDDLISSSQTELEKLKNIKSALLEKMFV